jgi:hypothetical protein
LQLFLEGKRRSFSERTERNHACAAIFQQPPAVAGHEIVINAQLLSKQVVIAGITPFQFMRSLLNFIHQVRFCVAVSESVVRVLQVCRKKPGGKMGEHDESGLWQKKKNRESMPQMRPRQSSSYMYTISCFIDSQIIMHDNAAGCIEVAYSP